MFSCQSILAYHKYNCVKSVRIRSYSGPHFPAFRLNNISLRIQSECGESADPKNSRYGHFSCGVSHCFERLIKTYYLLLDYFKACHSVFTGNIRFLTFSLLFLTTALYYVIKKKEISTKRIEFEDVNI